MRGRKGKQEEERVKIKLDKIGSLNSEFNPVISLTTGPAEGQRAEGKSQGFTCLSRNPAWGCLGGELENLKWEAPGRPAQPSPLGLTLGGAASTQCCGASDVREHHGRALAKITRKLCPGLGSREPS